MSGDSFEEDDSATLRQRLWGAAVLIAIAVIVLPLLLDGAGSESQFRRVERLREEPPAILDSEGNRTVQKVPEMSRIPRVQEVQEIRENTQATTTTEWVKAVEDNHQSDSILADNNDSLSDGIPEVESSENAVSEVESSANAASEVEISEVEVSENEVAENKIPEVGIPENKISEDEPAMTENVPTPAQPSLTAWVVQAAALTDEQEALQLRDQLRRAGFASFVRDRDDSSDPFRVLVGPMIKKVTAEKARLDVAALLQNSPTIMIYP